MCQIHAGEKYKKVENVKFENCQNIKKMYICLCKDVGSYTLLKSNNSNFYKLFIQLANKICTKITFAVA